MKDNSNKLHGRTVFSRENENINQLLRKFKKKVDDSGVLEDLRNKESYIKPSIQRKKTQGAAKARWQKKIRDQQLPPKLY